MPNYKGFVSKDSKTQPAKCGGYEGVYNGDAHDFNIKSKVTKMGGCYADLGCGSGMGGNYADKDASISYLKERNKKGQEVKNFSATSMESKVHTGGGLSAYNSNPIPETYKPATSQGEIDPNAVIYKNKVKDRDA